MITPIRWAGSKKALLPELRKYWGAAQGRYVEPFCGSACLFFDIEPREAILGDINQELITTYRAIRSSPSHIMDRLSRMPKTKSNYYRTRAINPSTLSDVEVAARFIFLNRLCFNGIYRTNTQGQFNVPYARPKGRINFEFETFAQMSSLLERAVLLNDDFENVLSEVERGDFVYLDPPFAVARRRVFSEYHPDSFSKTDIARLRRALKNIDRKGAHFVVSYADSAEGRLLSSDWDFKRIRTRRNVAGFSGDRRVAYELIASNRELPKW